MATLEKIRKRSVLLLVVIAVALLAFILGDALTNGRNLFGNATTVAKVGGEKIDIQEFQQKREELNQQYEEARKNNPQSVANIDVQTLPQMALEQLIDEKLIGEAVSKMDIRTTAPLLRFYMLEYPQPLPELQQIITALQQQNLNVANAQQAYDVIFNPKRYNLTESQVAPFRRSWLALEGKYQKEISKMTYANLLQRTVKANKLDKQALYNDYVETTSVSLAYVPYGQLDEKKYPVKDADIQKVYEEEKYTFKVDEPTKEIAFIAFNVTPSDADRQQATALAAKTATALRAGQLSKELKKEGLAAIRHELKASDIQLPALKNFVTTAPADSVSIVESNFQGFKVAKMIKSYAAVDSIEVRSIQVMGKTLPSKVMAQLNAGLAADSLATKFSADSVVATPAQWLPLYTAEGKTPLGIQQATLDSLINSNGRYIVLNEAAEGAVLATVTKKTAPVEIYEFEEVDYAIQPSAKTLEDARAKMEKFLAANNTAAKFRANAAKNGYNVQDFQLTQSSPAVPRMQGYNMYYPDSRQVVRWVMIDGEKGRVSHIYESKDAAAPALYAAAVLEEYDDYVPVSSVTIKEYLTEKARRGKAGDAMVKQYQAKGNLQAVANAMGVEAREITDFRFGRGAGVNDPAVIGKIAGAKAGTKMVVVKGDDGVYAYIIKGKGKEKFEYDDASYENQFMQTIRPDLSRMIRGNRKIENNQYKFEAGD